MQPVQPRSTGILTSDSLSGDTLDAAELAQPLCTAVQIAVVNFLAKCGMSPGAVIGHSSGEIAAAYASGVLSQSEAVLCAYYRGQALKTSTRSGSMAAIGLDRQSALPYLLPGVQVACENGPTNITVSGDSDAVNETLKSLETQDSTVFTRLLNVPAAYHSRELDLGVD